MLALARRAASRSLAPASAVFPRVAAVVPEARAVSALTPTGHFRFFRAEPDRAKSAALGVGSTLLPAIEDSTFLVSHPINAPGRRTVTFVVRCDAANVISYQLPDSVREGRAKMDASVLCSVPTMMMAAYGPAAGAFDTLDYSPLAEDVKAGKLLVVTHADPWGVMVSATQASAWVSLLKSLGGKYASLAEQASHSSHIMQRHPLIDLI